MLTENIYGCHRKKNVKQLTQDQYYDMKKGSIKNFYQMVQL